MPYLERGVKASIEDGRKPMKPGELNYEITRAIDSYVVRHGAGYGAINDVLGALEGAKLEFYRRVAVPYETKKALENGDVYVSVE